MSLKIQYLEIVTLEVDATLDDGAAFARIEAEAGLGS